MRKPTENQALWILCLALFISDAYYDLRHNGPDQIDHPFLPVFFLVVIAITAWMVVDPRAIQRRLAPRVPDDMGRGGELFMRFTSAIIASTTAWTVIWHFLRPYLQ